MSKFKLNKFKNHAIVITIIIIIIIIIYIINSQKEEFKQDYYNRTNIDYNRTNIDYNRTNIDYNRPNIDYNRTNIDYNRPNIDYNRKKKKKIEDLEKEKKIAVLEKKIEDLEKEKKIAVLEKKNLENNSNITNSLNLNYKINNLNYIINNINYKQLEIKKEIKNLKNSSTEKNIFKYYKEQFYKMFI